MDRTDAVTVLQTLWPSVATLIGHISSALQDGKVSPAEGLQLGLEAVQLSSAILRTLTPLDLQGLQAVRAVLERTVLRVGDDH